MQHVVVTGGSSGLGAAVARAYAARGVALTLLARSRERLEDVCDDCERISGVRPVILECDVADAAAMKAALEGADDNRPVDVVIANAGIGGSAVLAPAHGETAELAAHILSVNTLGVVHTLAPLIPRMCKRGRGQIVIVGSVAGYFALPQSPVYSAAKAATQFYGHGLRRLLRHQGVDVTVISPGFINTPMSRSLPYTTPFLVGADRAASIVLRAIDRRSASVIFPWPFRVAVWMKFLLPSRFVDQLLAIAAAQSAKERT